MEKIYRTKTDSNERLEIDSGKGWLIAKGIEVKAKVNLDTGEVNFFIEKQDLEKLKKIEAEKERSRK